jgi:hypothetical protein
MFQDIMEEIQLSPLGSNIGGFEIYGIFIA